MPDADPLGIEVGFAEYAALFSPRRGDLDPDDKARIPRCMDRTRQRKERRRRFMAPGPTLEDRIGNARRLFRDAWTAHPTSRNAVWGEGIAFRIEGNERGNEGIAHPRCSACNSSCTKRKFSVGDCAPRLMERDPRLGEGRPGRKEPGIGCGEGVPEIIDSRPPRKATSAWAEIRNPPTWSLAAMSW